MSENEKLGMERDQENGQITYANEVIAMIVSVATTEVEGISGISGAGAIGGILGKGKVPRGVKVDMTGNSVKVDVSVTVDYGIPIQKVGRNAQENVRKSIESMTGLHVESVDLHVVGVSFEKENQELQEGQKLALSLEGEHMDASSAQEEAQAEEEQPEEPQAEEYEADCSQDDTDEAPQEEEQPEDDEQGTSTEV